MKKSILALSVMALVAVGCSETKEATETVSAEVTKEIKEVEEASKKLEDASSKIDASAEKLDELLNGL